jgi:hypothetical protein
MSAQRYLPAARNAAQTIPATLAQRGLKPFISRCVLTETERGAAWLFVVFEAGNQEHPEDYAAPDVLHDLSTALQGLPVVISNTDGLRYGVLLGSPNLLNRLDRF